MLKWLFWFSGGGWIACLPPTIVTVVLATLMIVCDETPKPSPSSTDPLNQAEASALQAIRLNYETQTFRDRHSWSQEARDIERLHHDRIDEINQLRCLISKERPTTEKSDRRQKTLRDIHTKLDEVADKDLYYFEYVLNAHLEGKR